MVDSLDASMLACHVASVTQLLLFFSGAISASQGLGFEITLLALKLCLELVLAALTPDLIFHHVGMAGAAYTAFVHYPHLIDAALFPQAIHIPLAVQYARRLAGGERGGALDRAFTATWLLVVAARGAQLGCVTLRAHHEDDGARWILYVCVVSVLVLDSQWTKETLEKRESPPWWWMLFALGVFLGSSFEHRMARAAWAVLCAAVLLLVGGILAVTLQHAMQEGKRRQR